MLRDIIGAIAGAKAAERTNKVDGAAGAVLGIIAVPLITRIARRMGPLGWIAATAGGYAYKRHTARRNGGLPRTRSGQPNAGTRRAD